MNVLTTKQQGRKRWDPVSLSYYIFFWFVQNTEFAFDIDQKNGGSLED